MVLVLPPSPSLTRVKAYTTASTVAPVTIPPGGAGIRIKNGQWYVRMSRLLA